MEADIKATVLALLTIGISLFTLYYRKYQLIIIGVYFGVLIIYFLFVYLNKIEEHDREISELKKLLKRTDDLIDLRADIKFLKNKTK